MRHAALALLVLLLALASVDRAEAQQHPVQLFAGGGIDSDPFTYAPDRDTAATLVAGIGRELPHHWLIRYELTFPAWHDLSNVDQCLCWTGDIPVNRTSSDRHRMITNMGIVGYEIRLGRVGLTPVAGAGGVIHGDREHDRITSLMGEELSDRSSSELRLHAAFVVGADAAVRLGDRLAVVPQIRLFGIPESERAQPLVRPSLVARFSF